MRRRPRCAQPLPRPEPSARSAAGRLARHRREKLIRTASPGETDSGSRSGEPCQILPAAHRSSCSTMVWSNHSMVCGAPVHRPAETASCPRSRPRARTPSPALPPFQGGRLPVQQHRPAPGRFCAPVLGPAGARRARWHAPVWAAAADLRAASLNCGAGRAFPARTGLPDAPAPSRSAPTLQRFALVE